MAEATVETKHPSYGSASDVWQTCRDVFEGSDAVKAAGVRYLPRLSDQTDEEYKAYVKRAEFYNAFARTVGGLAGTAFTRTPAIEAPESVKAHLADVTLASQSFELVAPDIVRDVLKVGRLGYLLDWSQTAKRPYWMGYSAEEICDWDTTQRGGDTVLSWLVLKECVVERVQFERKEIVQYRTLELVFTDDPAVCVVKIWRKAKSADGKDTWVVHGTPSTLMRLGVALPFIPFVCFNPTSIGLSIQKPPLKDLVDLNLSHYRSSADLEHARHFTMLPTLFVKGVPTTEKIRIGSSEALVTQNIQADAKFIEFTGQGLGPGREALKDKEQRMAVLGSRLLESQKAGQEAADTVRMRHAGDNATLQDIVGTVSHGLTMLLRWHAWWFSATQVIDDPKITVTLNTDFLVGITNIDTLSLLAQAGKISYETLYFNLERSGLTRPGVTAEMERRAIMAEGADDPNAGETDDDDDEAGDEGEDPELTEKKGAAV